MEFTPHNLFEQLTSVQRNAVAALIGFDGASPGFCNALRRMPAMENCTLGAVAVAYLDRVRAELAAIMQKQA